MIYKLRTSSATQDTFSRVGQLSGLPPFVLSKIAISLSLRHGLLTPEDFKTNTDGLELNRQTIFGEYETLYRSLITCQENRQLKDEEFFPKMVKAHLDRGARLLENEAKYSKNIFTNLCQLDGNL